jgi:hypothetical protein
MSRKKISTTIYVTPEQSERLRLLHERTKVPVAVYIREGIDLVLRQYGHLLPGQLSLAADAPSQAAAASPAPPPVAPVAPVAPLAGRTDGESKPAGHRQERASGASAASATNGEPIPERAAGGKG